LASNAKTDEKREREEPRPHGPVDASDLTKTSRKGRRKDGNLTEKRRRNEEKRPVILGETAEKREKRRKEQF